MSRVVGIVCYPDGGACVELRDGTVLFAMSKDAAWMSRGFREYASESKRPRLWRELHAAVARARAHRSAAKKPALRLVKGGKQ